MQALLFILVNTLFACTMFGQSLGSNLPQEEIQFKGSSPSGENVIVSMLHEGNPSKNSYIQIYNADVSVVDLTGWTLVGVEDGNDICTWNLSGTIKPGETKTAGDDGNQDFTPDFIYDRWQQVNNHWDGKNDGARLYKNGNLIDDALSTIDWSSGTLQRVERAGTTRTTFSASDWAVFALALDESYHHCVLPIIDIGPGIWSELTADYSRGVSYNIIGEVNIDVSTPAECYSMYIPKGSTLNVEAQKALTIYKNLNNYGGNEAFNIKTNTVGSGSVIIYGVSDNGTFEQYFSDIRLQTWKFISSPVTKAVSAIFQNDYLMYYYEPQLRYVNIVPSNVNLKVSRGYSVLKSQDHIEKYEGIFNGGTVKVPTLTNSLDAPYSTTEFSGWNLIGNPYASSIDWDQVVIPSKMNGHVSVWSVTDCDGEMFTDWKVWVKGVGDQEAHYIDPGEGFFVFTNGTENLTFENNMRVHHFDDAGSTKSLPEEETEIMSIRAIGNHASSNFYLRFLEEASAGFDPLLDAYKMLSESEKLPQIYNVEGSEILAINSIPSPAENDSLHLGFKCGVEGDYQLDFQGLENFKVEQDFYLRDQLTGKIYNLRQNALIDFTYKLSDPENRFDLLFGLINGVDDVVENTYGSTIYSANGKIYARSEYPTNAKLQVEVRNLLGQTLYTSSSIEEFANGKNLSLPNATYLVSLRAENFVYTKKLAVYN